MMNAIEATIGTAAKIRIYDDTGGYPADCAAATLGNLLAEFVLASDWMGASSGGIITLLNVPMSTTSLVDGTPLYYRIWNTAVSACGAQGGVGVDGTGADLIISAPQFATGDTITINSFTAQNGSG